MNEATETGNFAHGSDDYIHGGLRSFILNVHFEISGWRLLEGCSAMPEIGVVAVRCRKWNGGGVFR